MTWVKKANNIGRYERTIDGFRVYCTKRSRMESYIEEREDGRWRVTNIIPGWFVAIDKTGCRFEGSTIGELYDKIKFEMINRYYDKK